MTLKKCPQIKCCYNIYGGCRPCKLCNAPPNLLDSNCDICHNCCFDEGLLRWDDNLPPFEEEDETQKNEEENEEEKEEEPKMEMEIKAK